jgi:oligoendopeptidase F
MKWELESLCPGGLEGPERRERERIFRARLEAIGARLAQPWEPDTWAETLQEHDGSVLELVDLMMLARCAISSDVRSPVARAAKARTEDLARLYEHNHILVEAAISALDDETFERFVLREDLALLVAWLREIRAGRAFRLDPALEALEREMGRDGQEAWLHLYETTLGGLAVDVRIGEEIRRLSLAQIEELAGSADLEVRSAGREARRRAYDGVRELFATILTALTGGRQQAWDRRRLGELDETLFRNRVAAPTLEALLAACRTASPTVAAWVRRKARLLGAERLDLGEFAAPVGSPPPEVDLAFAARTVTEAFDAFHPDLGAFAARALACGWVDALPAPGRAAGAFCGRFPRTDQSRVFLQFGGTFQAVTVLAHELGHAWHNEMLRGGPGCRARPPVALAESASLFAEGLVFDHLLALAAEPGARVFLLDRELRAAATLTQTVPQALAFERLVYAARRQGPLTADQLDALTVEQQHETWGDALGEPMPWAWCGRKHLFTMPFYNWPYTFGALFGALLRARARAEGSAFFETWNEVLRRSAWQPAEVLVTEVLGLDPADQGTWDLALARVRDQVDAYLAATQA